MKVYLSYCHISSAYLSTDFNLYNNMLISILNKFFIPADNYLFKASVETTKQGSRRFYDIVMKSEGSLMF